MEASERYRHYEIRDFVKDPFFQRWVLNADTETDAFWRAWLAANPDRQFVLEEARKMIRLLGFTKNHDVNERLLDTWASIQARAADTEDRRMIAKRPLHSHLFKAAAVLLVLTVAGITLWYLNFRTITVHTGFGTISSVTLPDGSVVDMNANSSLEYAKHWDDNAPREVWLKGEAFFSVAHNPDRKFIVRTANDVTVNVLGTTFNVLSRRNTMRVSLNTGKIHIALGEEFLRRGDNPLDDGFDMMPGEVAELDLESSSITRHAAEVEQYVSWKEKKMVFDNTSMEEVAIMLQDIHGLKVHVDDALKGRRITGEFQSDDLDILIQFVARALDAQVIRGTSEIQFESNNSKQ